MEASAAAAGAVGGGKAAVRSRLSLNPQHLAVGTHGAYLEPYENET